MQDTALVFFPIPLITALLCAAISLMVLRLDWGSRRASIIFSVLFAVFTVALCLVSLRFGYGYADLILVQRLLPLLVGPLMYLGFAAYAFDGRMFQRSVWLHIGSAIAVIAALVVLPGRLLFLDALISASYVLYIVLLLKLWRRGADALSFARLDVAQTVSNWMLRGAGLLGTVLLLDSIVALDFVLTGGRNASALISYGSVPMIALLLACLIALPPMLAPKATPDRASHSVDDESSELEGRVRAVLQSTQLYLEPDLSVQRLARRMHVTERALSVAINQSQQMNVSQYVNCYRLEHAADLLRGTDDSVAKIMQKSGFLTRSNFYREFQRHFGESPAAYRQLKNS